MSKAKDTVMKITTKVERIPSPEAPKQDLNGDPYTHVYCLRTRRIRKVGQEDFRVTTTITSSTSNMKKEKEKAKKREPHLANSSKESTKGSTKPPSSKNKNSTRLEKSRLDNKVKAAQKSRGSPYAKYRKGSFDNLNLRESGAKNVRSGVKIRTSKNHTQTGHSVTNEVPTSSSRPVGPVQVKSSFKKEKPASRQYSSTSLVRRVTSSLASAFSSVGNMFRKKKRVSFKEEPEIKYISS